MSVENRVATQDILKNVLTNAMKSYIMWIPRISMVEAPAGDYDIWKEDIKDLLEETNLLEIADRLSSIYWEAYSAIEDDNKQDNLITDMNYVIETIVNKWELY